MTTSHTSAQPSPIAVDTAAVERLAVTDGIVRRSLPSTDYASGWIIDFAPGTQWRAIDHHDTEERYFVLTGEVIDGHETYPVGSYVVFPAGSQHQPRTEVGATTLGINIRVQANKS
jgi:mannose-6-phosphate isomerase-like protein (cupin superfamily)